jgi:hypothetical protein
VCENPDEKKIYLLLFVVWWGLGAGVPIASAPPFTGRGALCSTVPGPRFFGQSQIETSVTFCGMVGLRVAVIAAHRPPFTGRGLGHFTRPAYSRQRNRPRPLLTGPRHKD